MAKPFTSTRSVVYHQCEALYIINAKRCISSMRSVVYHPSKDEYISFLDEYIIKSQNARLRVMICSPKARWYAPHYVRRWYAKSATWIQKIPFYRTGFFGAGGGGRTRTVSLPLDFESSTSANSITPACVPPYRATQHAYNSTYLLKNQVFFWFFLLFLIFCTTSAALMPQ